MRVKVESRNPEQAEQNYVFSENDIQKVFSVFGQLEKVVIKEQSVFYVLYSEFFSAYSAFKSLNNFFLPDLKATLVV